MIPNRAVCISCAREVIGRVSNAVGKTLAGKLLAADVARNLSLAEKCKDGTTCKCLLFPVNTHLRASKYVPKSCRFLLEHTMANQ
jgi:hypothetical protein